MHSRSSAAPIRESPLSRRAFLRRGVRGVGALGLGLFGGSVVVPRAHAAGAGADSFGPLRPPDANGLRLPPGFASRVVATSGQPVGATPHTWHLSPDGGATFGTEDGGWIYVSNSEEDAGAGGVGAIRFAADGSISDAYPILEGTSRNCAGGPTPWGTWLSCEEIPAGRVFECDPFTPGAQGILRPPLGTFQHEAAAVDLEHLQVYLSEDRVDGLLYRLTIGGSPVFEAAEILDPGDEGPIQPGSVRPLAWHPVTEPNPAGGGIPDPLHLPVSQRATRYQVPEATAFDRIEGCWFAAGRLYCASTGDCRVWRVDTGAQTIEILYDAAASGSPRLTNVDNVYASPLGDVYVAEDPGDLQIVALTASGGVKPIVQVTGQSGTEITGPALNPDGTRLYFSSQRAPGTTYEVTGPFGGVPRVPLLDGVGRTLLSGALAAAAALALRGRR